MTFTDTLFGARLYVLAFAICLIAPAALLSIARPESDGPRSTAHLAVNFATFVLLDTACLVAVLDIKPRVVRWLAAMVLSAGVLRYGYMELGAGRNWSEALLFLVMSFPFLGGPMCVGIWLCFPRFQPRPDQPETGPSVVGVLRRETD